MTDAPPLLVDLSSARGRLRVSGEDRVRFLNGQFSNDLRALKPLGGCYGVFPNAKGRVRADGVALNPGPCLLVDTEPDAAASLAADLERFVIADDVAIETLGEAWRGFVLLGVKASRVLRESGLVEAPPEALFSMACLSEDVWENGFAFRSRRAALPSYDLWIPSHAAASVGARLEAAVDGAGGKRSDLAAREILRVEAGIPRFGLDFDATTLPQEADLEEIGISFTKGCYVGQEVISRIKSVGHVNRALARLRLPPEAKTGDPLVFSGREAGRLGSVIVSPRFGPIGLAILRREAVVVGARLALPQGEAIVVARFEDTP
ncbi:MAG: folate-binding protein YgfZ [Verrucomicrobiae bacterium]|nr:folate-binding protein YgfZ [Verrucomicrobiae bacterium]